jgi:hypothetical protein
MSAEQVRESIIVADCGRGLIRATLVEVIEGVCRFVAQGTSPSTVEPPHEDLGTGLREALAALEAATARRFTDRTRVIMPQEDTGDGTDAFLASVAATPPLRVAILASSSGAVLNALLTVARRSPVTVLPALTIDPEAPLDDATHATIAALGRLRPDLLLIVTPTETERALPRLLGLAGEIVGAPPTAETDAVPAILVLAGEVGRDAATVAFGRGYEFGFLPIDELDPTNLALTIEAEILDLGNRRAAAALPGFENMTRMSVAPPLARARAIDLVNRFMGLQFGCEVITVDLDEGFTYCWSRNSEGRALSEPALDLALGAANLLTALPLSEVIRWIPFSISEDEIRNWILNRALRPFTIPTSQKDQLIEAAIVRELLHTGTVELGSNAQGTLAPDLLVGGSFFARWPNPVEAFLTLIDGIDPRPVNGLVQVALDRDGLLPLVGVLGVLEPDRAAELFEHDGLLDLGACIIINCPVGEEVQGEMLREVGQPVTFSVTGGTMLRLPLAEGERAKSLRFAPGGRAQIGQGGAGKGAVFEAATAPHGGPVGLVIDARGRPLPLARNEQDRFVRLQSWATALGKS